MKEFAWHPGNHPIELYNKVINQKLTYIHQNPVEEGWFLILKTTCIAVLMIAQAEKDCWI